MIQVPENFGTIHVNELVCWTKYGVSGYSSLILYLNPFPRKLYKSLRSVRPFPKLMQWKNFGKVPFAIS